jgi:hypothetical protein
MALKQKFVAALGARAGLTQPQAELAVNEAVALIKTKVPPHVGYALDQLLASENGIDHALFDRSVGKTETPPPAPITPQGPFAVPPAGYHLEVEHWSVMLLKKFLALIGVR